MNIKELLDFSRSYPTIMGLGRELILIDHLLAMDIKELKNNVNSFYEILRHLQTSHFDDYVNVEENDKPKIITFINWLKKIKEDNIFHPYILEDLIDIFSIRVCEDEDDE